MIDNGLDISSKLDEFIAQQSPTQPTSSDFEQHYISYNNHTYKNLPWEKIDSFLIDLLQKSNLQKESIFFKARFTDIHKEQNLDMEITEEQEEVLSDKWLNYLSFLEKSDIFLTLLDMLPKPLYHDDFTKVCAVFVNTILNCLSEFKLLQIQIQKKNNHYQFKSKLREVPFGKYLSDFSRITFILF